MSKENGALNVDAVRSARGEAWWLDEDVVEFSCVFSAESDA